MGDWYGQQVLSINKDVQSWDIREGIKWSDQPIIEKLATFKLWNDFFEISIHLRLKQKYEGRRPTFDDTRFNSMLCF